MEFLRNKIKANVDLGINCFAISKWHVEQRRTLHHLRPQTVGVKAQRKSLWALTQGILLILASCRLRTLAETFRRTSARKSRFVKLFATVPRPFQVKTTGLRRILG